MKERKLEDLRWRPSPFAEIGRYLVAVITVTAFGAGTILWIGHEPEGQVASDTDEAVLLDLPPALVSSAPTHDAADGPEQPAIEAATPVTPPKELVQPPKPDDPLPERVDPKPPIEKMPDEAHPPPAPVPEQPTPRPAPPDLPKPTPPVEKPPPPVAAAPSQQETAPSGIQAPAKEAEQADSETARRRAAHAISRWQRAMMTRLEIAKKETRSGGLVGRVDVAFEIDRHGRLRSDRVVRSSGSKSLDKAALALLTKAAPFPDPPTDVSEAALTFTVPVVFARK